MKVVWPSKNPITTNYSTNHKGYDFAGLNLPDEVKAGAGGILIERANQYNSNWINTGTLTTRDYGNYIKIKHDDGTSELHAHLKLDSMLAVGTRVSTGQVVARIGNTGNSSGPHLHSEYRNAQNVNESVEFINEPLPVPPTNMNDTKKAVQFDRILTFLKSQGYIASDNSSEYLENDRVVELVKGLWADRIVDRPKASNWDRIVLKAGLPANATVDQVVAKLQTGSFDKNAFLEGVRKLLFG